MDLVCLINADYGKVFLFAFGFRWTNFGNYLHYFYFVLMSE